MFSTGNSFASPPVSSLRNPRRRQRTHSSENGLPGPEPKRRRSVLTQDVFKPLKASDNAREGGPVKTNGAATKPESSAPTSYQLAVRDHKKSHERAAKGDTSTLLTRNDYYAVNHLPALPDAIRNVTGGNVRAEIYADAESGLCLGLTSTGAVIWQYCSSSSSPETFTFDITQYARISAENLPLGSLVYSPSSVSDIGLLLVAPSNGKIMFWESITASASLDSSQQQKQCIEGSVGGLFSGDSVVQLLKAEPAGYILRFRSGRLAQLSVRDEQGRPAVVVQFMKGLLPNKAPSGLFGSIRSAFGSNGWRRDVVSVKAGHTSKQLDRQIIVATERGIFQIWEIHRNGHHALRGEVDASEAIHKVASDNIQSGEDRQNSNNVKVLDFVLFPDSGTEHLESRSFTGLLVLVSHSKHDYASYSLLDLTIYEDEAKVNAIQLIRCYQSSLNHHEAQGPKLLLPKPGHVAFVAFQTAVIVASVQQAKDTAEDQLLRESHAPMSFQDIVDFRPGLSLQITGAGSEDASDSVDGLRSARRKSKHPSCALFVPGYGMIRITSVFTPSSPSLTVQAAVKSKIEQAILYGSSSENILNFAGRAEMQYSLGEIETAALEVSSQIVDSTSCVVPTITPSMSTHLSNRAVALKSLALYIRNTFPPLSRKVKWRLLWDAEQIASAQGLWKYHNASLKQFQNIEGDDQLDTIASSDRAPGLAAILDFLPPEVFTPMAYDQGEEDPVRHWFTKDLSRIQLVVALAWQTLLGLQKFHEGDPELLRSISDMNDVCIGALPSAFEFRQDNVGLYGLRTEHLSHGVFDNSSDYADLPLPWTSFRGPLSSEEARLVSIPESLNSLVSVSLEASGPYLEDSKKPAKIAPKDIGLARKIQNDAVALLDIYMNVGNEASKWIEAQPRNQTSDDDRRFSEEYRGSLEEWLQELGSRGMLDESINLAEKYLALNVLALLQYFKFKKLEENQARPGAKDELLTQKQTLLDYFEKPGFGQDWAVNLFSTLLVQNRACMIIDSFESKAEYVEQFLHSDNRFARLSWINDILNTSNYSDASGSLLKYEQATEANLWSKKMELSIGKLSLLANAERLDNEASTDDTKLKFISQTFERVRAQEFITTLLSPLVESALDESAAVQLLMESLTKYTVKGKPTLKTNLEKGFTTLLADEMLSEQQLIDVHTLISLPEDTEFFEPADESLLFLQALRVVASCRAIISIESSTLEKIIWRRCMLRSNWINLNKTEYTDDTQLEERFGDTLLFRLLRQGYAEEFWSPEKGNGEPWRPVDVLDAGCSAEKLSGELSLNQREALARDLLAESDVLSKQIEKGRLDLWFDGIVDAAKKSVEQEKVEEAQIQATQEQLARSMRLNSPEYQAGDGEDGVTEKELPQKEGEDDVDSMMNGDMDLEMETDTT